MTVTVKGADELIRDLRTTADKLGDLLDPADAATGNMIASAARARAPHRSGRLRSAIRPVSTKTGVQLTANLPYAGVIHWGWPRRNIRATTFLVDAARATETRWVDAYTDALQEALDNVGHR